jgi:hypothetical protein
MNKTLIKESAIRWLIGEMARSEEYNDIDIVGTYAKLDAVVYPIVAVSVSGENIITNQDNGLLSIDIINDTKDILYKSMFSLNIDVYAEIDDEADRIAEIIVDRIRDRKYNITVHGIRVEKIGDNIAISDTRPVDTSGNELYITRATVPIMCYEVKRINMIRS